MHTETTPATIKQLDRNAKAAHDATCAAFKEAEKHPVGSAEYRRLLAVARNLDAEYAAAAEAYRVAHVAATA